MLSFIHRAGFLLILLKNQLLGGGGGALLILSAVFCFMHFYFIFQISLHLPTSTLTFFSF